MSLEQNALSRAESGQNAQDNVLHDRYDFIAINIHLTIERAYYTWYAEVEATRPHVWGQDLLIDELKLLSGSGTWNTTTINICAPIEDAYNGNICRNDFSV